MAATKEREVPAERPVPRRFTLGWPFGEPPAWAREFERAVGGVEWPRGFFPTLTGKSAGETAWAPALEAFERNGTFVVRAELPGLDAEHVTVEVEGNHLVIHGEREEEKEEKEPYFRTERAYGAFYRAVPIPDHVDLDTVKARFENGVLEVTCAVTPTAEKKPRRVAIDTPGARPGKVA